MISLQAVKKRLTGRGALQTVLHTSAANLLIMILSTLTSIVTARLFGVSGKGEFSAILFWPTLLAGLVSFGLPTSLIFNMRTNAGKAAEYVRAGFLFQIPVSLIVGIMAWIYLPVWLGQYSEAVIQVARWYTVLTLPMLLAVNLLAALTQSMDKFSLYNGLRLYVPLSNLVGLLVLWSVGKLTIPNASFAFFATSLMVIIWSLYRLRGELTFNWFKRSRTPLCSSRCSAMAEGCSASSCSGRCTRSAISSSSYRCSGQRISGCIRSFIRCPACSMSCRWPSRT